MPRIHILADNADLYDSNINNTSRAILEPSLPRDLEGSPQFEFKILPDHPEYNNLNRLKTKVHVYLDEDELFYGRVLDYETDMWLQRTVKCEGAISFLVDSMDMPQKEERKTQVRAYFEYLINEHNSQVEPDKQFVIGTFSHPDADEYIKVGNGSYRTVKDAIQNDLISIRGGYLNVRYVNGVNYIDFVYDPSVPSGQSFEIGENIIDLMDSTDSMEVCTILYPVGEGNLTIEEVAGHEYIESAEGIARYGRIAKSKTFKGVTTARELYDKAVAYLNSKINKVYKNFTLTAIDLGLINNTSKVKPGSVVHLYSQGHGIDGDYMCYETTTNLFNPEEDSFTFKEWVSNEDALVETNTTSKWEHHYGNFTHEWVKNFEHDFDEYFKIHADYILLDARERIDILAGDLIMLSSKYIELDAQQRIQLKAINENSDGLINVISDLTFIGGELFDTENRLTELGKAVYRRIEGVEGSVTAIGTEVNLIGDKAITNEGRIAELGQSVTQINSDVILLGDQTRELNDFYDALHTTVDGHTRSITAITTDVTLIGNKADQAIADLEDLSGSVVALEADNVVLHGDVTNLTTRVGNISAEQITISTQVDDIEQRLVTIEGDTVTIDGKIVALAGDVSSMKTDGFTTVMLNATGIIGGNTSTGTLTVTGATSLAGLTSSGQIVANGGIASSGECGFRSASIGTLTVSGTLQSAHAVSMTGIGSANFLGTDDVSFDHYHSFTTGTDGVITIGGPSLTPGNFNIADTKFYKDEIKRIRVTDLIGSWDEENEQYIITCQNESSGSVYEKPISASHAISYGESQVTLSVEPWSSNKAVVNASNGESVTVDATSIYNNGVSSVTLSGGTTWTNGTTTVSASNGQSKSVSLPTFSSDVSINWTSDWKKTVNFSTPSVSVPLKSEIIDASGVYSTGYRDGVSSGGSEGYASGYEDGVASVTLSGGTTWSSNKTTVTASNGKTLEVDATSIYNNGYSTGENSVTLSGGTIWSSGTTTITASNGQTQSVNLPAFSSSVSTNWTSDWKKTVNFSTASVSVPLRSETIDASGVYNSGVSSVTLSGGTTWSSNKTTVSASNGQTKEVDATSIYDNGRSVGAAAVTLSGGTTWSSNKTTVLASNGKSITVDATSIYNNGYNAGEDGVTISGGTTWTNGSTTVTASNGRTQNVSLPAFSSSVSANWSSSWTKTVNFSTASVSVPLRSETIDASGVYNSGVSSVTLSGGTTWSSNKTTVTASNGKSITVDATSIYANGYRDGVSAGGSEGYESGYEDGVASVTLSGGTTWSSNKTTVTASNGKTLEVDATSVYDNGRSVGAAAVTLSGGTTWSSNKTTVLASNGRSITVDATSIYTNGYISGHSDGLSEGYDSGYNDGEASVTLSGGTTWSSNKTTVSASNGQSLEVNATSVYNSGASSVTLSGGTTWSSNKTTVSASNGKSVTVDATSIYNNGVSSVTLSGGTVWNSGTTTVTASNGQTQSVALPSFSSSVSANWSSSWTKTVNFSTPSVSVPLKSETIDASGVYNSGVASVTLSGGTTWSSNKTTVTASNGQTKEVDATSVYNAGVSSVTLSGGTTWSSNKTTVTASNGESLEVDATSRYNSGYSSGQSSVTLSGGTSWSSNKTNVLASNGKSITVDATSIYTNGYSAGHSDGVSEGYDSGYSAGESAGYDSGYAAGWAAAAATFSSGISGNVISVTGPSTTVGSSTSSSYTVTAAVYNLTCTGTYSSSSKVVTANAGATGQAYVNGNHVASSARATTTAYIPAGR